MPKIQIYTESKTFKFSKQQMAAFEKLQQYDVNVSHFVRLAIKEKLARDWKSIKEEKTREKLPF